MKIGRVLGTAVLGLLFMLFVAVDLLAFGVVALNSPVITVLPIVGLVLGGALGAMASKRTMTPVPAPAPSLAPAAAAPAPAPTAPTMTSTVAPPPPPPPSSPPPPPPPV